MDIWFFVSIAVVGILSAANSFLSEQKFSRIIKIIPFVFILLCLGFQSWYGLTEKKAADLKAIEESEYQSEDLSKGEDILNGIGDLKRNGKKSEEILKGIDDLKEKDKKGLLTDSDYSMFIVRYLESIDHTLKFLDSKNTRKWITTYYEEVSRIPSYFSHDDWTSSEKLIYKSMVGEINGDFASRGFYSSGARITLLETFQQEREKLISAKKRDIIQSNE